MLKRQNTSQDQYQVAKKLNLYFIHLTGLRFVQVIKILFKYRDWATLKNSFVSPYPSLSKREGSVGR